MQYAIIGAGGTGGVMGYFMTKAGKDVTLIARGRHLEAMKEHGLTLERLWDRNPETIAVKATDMEHYKEQPDVILVCVKGYSLEDTVPFIRRVAKPDTIVIPILNIYGTGAKLQKELPELLVTDGCIYVSANIKEPGVLVQHGKILRIVFGVREKTDWRPELEQIRQDFTDSAIDGILSENIRREALEKFSYVSPIGAAGLYCNAVAGDFQEEGAPRELFCSMIREIAALADAMGVPFQKDMVDVNLHILSNLAPETTTSAQNIIKEFNVKATTINSEVTKNSDIIFLAVKPFFFKEVIEEIKDVVKEDVIIISIAAGVTIEQIEEWFGKKIKLVRTMPNTPALVGEGMSAICPNNNVSEEELNYIGKLYNLFGKYEVIAEKDFHAFIALCGSSPAYVFMFIEAMADAGVKLGLPRAKAYKLAEQSILGSAKLALETGKHPGVLKDEVCSPGGTTIEAVIDLEKNGFRNTVISAIEKCANKSKNI